MSKKVLFLLIAVLTASYVQAQVNFGVRAGLNYSNKIFFVPAGAASMSTEMKPGFQAGIIAESNTTDITSFMQSGLLFVSQECKFKDGSLLGYSNETLNMTYLRLPLNYVYKKDLSGIKLLLQGGINLDFALSCKINGEKRGEKIEEKVDFGNTMMSRIESGVGVGAGLQFGNFQAVLEYNFGYNWGKSDSKIMMFNNGPAFNISYLFGK